MSKNRNRIYKFHGEWFRRSPAANWTVLSPLCMHWDVVTHPAYIALLDKLEASVEGT